MYDNFKTFTAAYVFFLNGFFVKVGATNIILHNQYL